MTAKEMVPAIGERVLLAHGPMNFQVEVKDVKFSWGKARFLVVPFAGNGEQWVEITSLRPLYASAGFGGLAKA